MSINMNQLLVDDQSFPALLSGALSSITLKKTTVELYYRYKKNMCSVKEKDIFFGLDH